MKIKKSYDVDHDVTDEEYFEAYPDEVEAVEDVVEETSEPYDLDV